MAGQAGPLVLEGDDVGVVGAEQEAERARLPLQERDGPSGVAPGRVGLDEVADRGRRAGVVVVELVQAREQGGLVGLDGEGEVARFQVDVAEVGDRVEEPYELAVTARPGTAARRPC
ncbi:hypothetical protein RB200_01605 [Streptomyces sp. PmtG]